jgi:hypothetical protein
MKHRMQDTSMFVDKVKENTMNGPELLQICTPTRSNLLLISYGECPDNILN